MVLRSFKTASWTLMVARNHAHGIARRGLLIRHLVMPGMLHETEAVLSFIAEELSTGSYLNLMDQYHPCYRAAEYPPLERLLSAAEFLQALNMTERFGLWRLDQRSP
jgi:putative pyruvate formate lyase activating enzyme